MFKTSTPPEGNEKKRRFSLGAFLQCLVIFIGLAIPPLWVIHLNQGIYQAAFMAALFLGEILLILILRKLKIAWIAAILVGFDYFRIAAVACAFLVCCALIGDFKNEPLKSDFFSGKNVLILVPHQDDDINLAGGVIEQYTRAGSKVSVVFTTNGDAFNQQDTRAKEVLTVMKKMGVSRENIYYLGFGDGWQPMEIDGQLVAHPYNSPDETLVWTSVHGQTQTYSTASIDCTQVLPYTRESYVKSIKDILLTVRPDVIYATDYDGHSDHRAASLFFEEAMCQILKEDGAYQPKLYKGLCYRNGWYDQVDFAGYVNIRSTDFVESAEFEVPLNQYPWEDRVRLPVLSTGLSRILTRTDCYELMSNYNSQSGKMFASAVLNGDKVFWERHTDSLLYSAEMQIGGTPVTMLNDFKLMDSRDITVQLEEVFHDGIQAIDGPVSVSLPASIDTKMLALYDDPRWENQILEGYIELADGNKVEFGPLNNNGSATYIPMEAEDLEAFTIHITVAEGTPGLTEIEAYSRDVTAPSDTLEYFMFVDEYDHVVYDYYIESYIDTMTFSLYTYPHNVNLDMDAFEITKTGSENCTYTFENGQLTVYCPDGESCDITVSYGDNSCNMVFSNPAEKVKWVIRNIQSIDNKLVNDQGPLSLNEQLSFYNTFFVKMQYLFAG